MNRTSPRSCWYLLPALFGLLLASMLATADDTTIPNQHLSMTADSRWSLQVPVDAHVVYRGVVSMDGAGTNSLPIMYPAPSVGGFLAAVITHGLLVDSAKRAQKDKMQEAADKVLVPYQGVIGALGYRELMQQAIVKSSRAAKASITVGAEESGAEVVLESLPVFSLTQDQKAIILDNAVVMRSTGSAQTPAYQNVIRVVSMAREVTDPVAYWTADGGKNMKDESAQLVAQSLDIAFNDATANNGGGDVPQRTVRYREGGNERIERAQILSDQCGRLLIRNLRGILMSVPSSRNTLVASAAGLCGSVATN